MPNTLELEVFECLSRLLKTGGLGLDPRATRLFRNKPYYSWARKGNIETDVSLELCLPGHLTTILIWVWECKDYVRMVSVKDLEAFDATLQEIGANNTKGTIITRNGFQRGAIEYAKSRKIGLARLVDHANIEFDKLQSPLNYHDVDAKALSIMQASSSDGAPAGIAGLDLSGYYFSEIRLIDYLSKEMAGFEDISSGFEPPSE